jgi:putative tryptophan/tyrosine transport system substrate-binding protein
MAIGIGRREFLSALGGAAIAWPRGARALQGSKVWHIGFLSAVSGPMFSGLYAGFLQGMRDLGYEEHKDFVTEFRTAEGDYERFPELARELVDLKVDVLLTGVAAAIRFLQQATTTVPIVMVYSTDPVKNGFVASLSHPGGNITGLAGSSDDTAPKQLELLTTFVPSATRIAVLGNPASPTYTGVLKSAQASAQKAGLSIMPIEARSPDEIENAFVMLEKENVRAIVVTGDALFFAQRSRIAELALRGRLPSIFPQREYVMSGGLMSYGEELSEFFRRAAFFVDKIFKGASPADLPVEQPTRFHLVINRKTADALGLTIPPQLYIFADEVIE